MRKRNQLFSSTRFRLLVLLLLYAGGAGVMLPAAEETIVLGAEDGWRRLTRRERLVTQPGRQGYMDLSVEPFRHGVTDHTELLLQFDELPVRDAAGRYEVQSMATGAGVNAPGPELTRVSHRTGRGALLVDGPEDRLLVMPSDDAAFAPGREWGSFTIEFWLYPVVMPDASTVLSWRAREGADEAFRRQELAIEVERGALSARFENFFIRPDGSGVTVTLEGSDRLIPRTWSHHVVRFSAQTGLLEYLVDGRPADITYVSRSGREDGSVYFPRIAAYPRDGLTIADGFVGMLDELRLEGRFVTEADQPVHPPDGGVLVSDYLDLGSPGARVRRIAMTADTPGMSDVLLYYRLANLRGTNPVPESAWTPIRPGDLLPDARGRFLQLRAELLPDTREAEPPTLSQISITFEREPPPLPPTALRAVPRDGAVVLEWAPVQEPDVEGYLVYYGEQSGRYFGRGSDQGVSPIDVSAATSVTIDGLENGTLYFFAVQAYRSTDIVGGGVPATRWQRHELSGEVAARPARVHR